MKRLLALLLMVLMLVGCQTQPAETTTAPPETTMPTETTVPSQPWVQEVGQSWDAEGVLLEVPLTIPGGWHYRSVMEFDGDLLLWSTDSHLEGKFLLELCLLELDDGTVLAQREIELTTSVRPQPLGDVLYLCDNEAGRILKLDKSLNTIAEWNLETTGGVWYMSATDTLFRITPENRLLKVDLTTEASVPAMESDPEISMNYSQGSNVLLEYYRPDTGASVCALLDLTTGQVKTPPTDGDFVNPVLAGDTWMWGIFKGEYINYLSTGGAEPLWISTTDSSLELLEEGYLVESTYDGCFLRLYDLQGRHISSCQVSETGTGYNQYSIWNESLGGLFFLRYDYDGGARLLFWDTSRGTDGEDLPLAQIPEPSEAEEQLRQRAKELGEAYGLTILVGEDCSTTFDDFTATTVTEWERVWAALDTLEQALEVYPEGFFDQLRYDTIRGIQIQLVSDLIATGNGRTGGGYSAFAQPQWDYYLVVIDIDASIRSTYYHEFSHIIDSFLAWDALQREDALFSEETWASFNPPGFEYSCDYSVEQYLSDFTCFVDNYSTIFPTEDRARVLEYAMSENCQWTFADAPGLRAKLEYYCACIQDAFDTTGWPEPLIWEQYLN